MSDSEGEAQVGHKVTFTFNFLALKGVYTYKYVYSI